MRNRFSPLLLAVAPILRRQRHHREMDNAVDHERTIDRLFGPLPPKIKASLVVIVCALILYRDEEGMNGECQCSSCPSGKYRSHNNHRAVALRVLEIALLNLSTSPRPIL